MVGFLVPSLTNGRWVHRKQTGFYYAEPNATKKVSTFLNRILALPLAEQVLTQAFGKTRRSNP